MVKICLVTTKTSLKTFSEAFKDVNNEIGGVLELEIFYTHLLDEREFEYVERFRKTILEADVVLLDIRSSYSWFVRELEDLLSKSRARLVIPLVAGSAGLLKLLKIGGLKGDLIVSRVREYDFDTQYIDMSRIWRIMRIFRIGGSLIPVKSLRDARNWALCIDYWSYWGKKNLSNLLRLLLREYLNFNVRYEKPVIEIPSATIYVPGRGFFNNLDKIDLRELDRPRVALFIYSGMHFDQSIVAAEALAEELKRLDIESIIIVGGGGRDLSRNIEALERFCRDSEKRVIVDAIVNFQWFTINGGPYGGPLEPTRRLLRELDVPLFNGLIMYMREISRWREDSRGLSPIEVITAVALPEIDGAIEPIPSAGLTNDYTREVVSIEERVRRKARRIAKWIRLRRKPNNEKRIAIIIYNYPPGEHNVGNAAYLDVFSSLENLLRYLKNRGFATEIMSKEEFKRLVEGPLRNTLTWSESDLDKIISMPTREYLRFFTTLPLEARRRIVEVWGEPPGDIGVVSDRIVIPGLLLGNVFIGVQPSRGVHENPEKTYHSKDLPPHHQYIAFYHWIESVFKADAIIHLGTHGTLEFMPGKEVGLSNNCYPDILISDTPNIYVYHVTNPSEMTIAKRRGYAYIVTHNTPPFTRSDLYEEYAELEELLHELEESRVQDPNRAELIERLVREKCEKINLKCDNLDEAHDKLYELKRSIIPKGLHIIGRVWSDDEIVEYLTLLLRYDRDVKSLHRVLTEIRGLNYDSLLEKPHAVANGRRAKDILEEIESEVKKLIRETIVADREPREIVRNLPASARDSVEEILIYARDLANRIKSSDELNSILRALEGRYIEPRVAGDPVRTPEIFPTGSHGYAFDPRLVPSKSAYIRGQRIAEDALRLYRERYGRYPETVGVVLWGFETMGTRGETIGEILHLLGVRLVRKHGPWSWDLEPIPLEELERPRIDVIITICGIFRDIFPNLITLLDRAIRLVASLDEPPELNYVKKHLVEMRDRYGENTLVRIFGPREGVYATRLTDVIETSNWRSESELADIYMEDMMYGYGENLHSKPLKELFREMLGSVDLVTQVRYAHEYEITDLDHYYEFLGGLKKAVERVKEKPVEVMWIDTTAERVKYRSLEEAIDHSVRTRILNPKYIEAMLSHGYDGVREIYKRIEYLIGLAATTNAVPNWVWDKIVERYILDENIRERMIKENQWAFQAIIRRLYEARERGYWKPSEDTIQALREIVSHSKRDEREE